MNEPKCDKTCSHYPVCIKRMRIQQVMASKTAAEALLSKEPNQRIEKAGEEAAAELGAAVSAWAGKWCPNRETAATLIPAGGKHLEA
jgi:hypothetical protein